MKTCTKCKKEQPLGEFYKYTHRNGYRPDCRDCRNAWSRAYGKTEEAKLKRRKKKCKWSEKNLNGWRTYIPNKANCEICGIAILFASGNTNTSIHFDHKDESCPIKISPMCWIMKHNFTEQNRKLWDESNFGKLCGKCNRALPTKNRRMWVFGVMKYVGGAV